jgi:hypothetical protein
MGSIFKKKKKKKKKRKKKKVERKVTLMDRKCAGCSMIKKEEGVRTTRQRARIQTPDATGQQQQ